MKLIFLLFFIVLIVICFTCYSFKKNNSPPNTQELGNATWVFLHTTAANYPDYPTEYEQNIMTNLILSLVNFYPCFSCRSNLHTEINQYHPDVSSNSTLQLWMCQLHNKVNRKLGKSEFPCDIDSLNARWNMNENSSEGTCQQCNQN
jgi:FAD-linked sulfhydryl oxidase